MIQRGAARPPALLRYPGGKHRLAPWIVSHFPKHTTYVEAFGGAGSVLLSKSRSDHEIYNDLNGEIVNLFRVLRDMPQALARALYLTPFSREEFATSYESSDDPLEGARRSFVRFHFAFGSAGDGGRLAGFRAGRSAHAGAEEHAWAGFPEWISHYTERLRSVVIEHDSAFALFARYDGRGVLWYLDPPYPQEVRSGADRPYRQEFSNDDHHALCQMIRELTGAIVLSGYPNDIYRRLLPDWRCVMTDTHTLYSQARTECLWRSPNIPPRQRELPF